MHGVHNVLFCITDRECSSRSHPHPASSSHRAAWRSACGHHPTRAHLSRLSTAQTTQTSMRAMFCPIARGITQQQCASSVRATQLTPTLPADSFLGARTTPSCSLAMNQTPIFLAPRSGLLRGVKRQRVQGGARGTPPSPRVRRLSPTQRAHHPASRTQLRISARHRPLGVSISLEDLGA